MSCLFLPLELVSDSDEESVSCSTSGVCEDEIDFAEEENQLSSEGEDSIGR